MLTKIRVVSSHKTTTTIHAFASLLIFAEELIAFVDRP